ncbi:MAG: hypothetical protein MJZ26_12175 [Fibrobacter sp.]|nr:hypothetical protein [Fibrobacter sp.]
MNNGLVRKEDVLKIINEKRGELFGKDAPKMEASVALTYVYHDIMDLETVDKD